MMKNNNILNKLADASRHVSPVNSVEGGIIGNFIIIIASLCMFGNYIWHGNWLMMALMLGILMTIGAGLIGQLRQWKQLKLIQEMTK